jgi:hypothetical protein
MLTAFFYSRLREYHPRMYVYNRKCLQLRTSDFHATLTFTLEWHADAKLSSRSLVQFPRNEIPGTEWFLRLLGLVR